MIAAPGAAGILCVATCVLACALAMPARAADGPNAGDDARAQALPDVEGLDGRALMELSYHRHQQYPFVYEEQSMVLVDRREERTARRQRRFSRMEDDGTLRLMLLFDSPPEIEGVALLATRPPDGTMEVAVYLPALGAKLYPSDTSGSGANFLGTDFTIENLTGEDLDDYVYARRRSRQLRGTPYHVVDVFDRRDDPATARPIRRHYLRADNLYVTRTDHFDANGRVQKRQTAHDLRAVDGAMWRGDMILMEDHRAAHRSLLKIDRRIFSRDYVPREMFELEWLVANHGPPAPPEAPPELTEIVLPDDLARTEAPR